MWFVCGQFLITCDFISHFLPADVPEIVPVVACGANLLKTQYLPGLSSVLLKVRKVCDNYLKS